MSHNTLDTLKEFTISGSRKGKLHSLPALQKTLGVKIDTALSLAVTIGVLASGILWSLWKTRNDMPEPAPGPKAAE